MTNTKVTNEKLGSTHEDPQPTSTPTYEQTDRLQKAVVFNVLSATLQDWVTKADFSSENANRFRDKICTLYDSNIKLFQLCEGLRLNPELEPIARSTNWLNLDDGNEDEEIVSPWDRRDIIYNLLGAAGRAAKLKELIQFIFEKNSSSAILMSELQELVCK